MRLHRDTFYSPYACRRDHRAHTKRLLAGFLLVFLAALLLPRPTWAGEIEADVINESYQNLWTAVGEAEEWPEDTESFLIDAYELWQDTAAGSHCETFASVVWAQALAVDAIGNETEDFGPVTTLALYLDDYILPLYNNCAEE